MPELFTISGKHPNYQAIPSVRLFKPSSAVAVREGGVSQLSQADPHKLSFTSGEAGSLGAKPHIAQAPQVQDVHLDIHHAKTSLPVPGLFWLEWKGFASHFCGWKRPQWPP